MPKYDYWCPECGCVDEIYAKYVDLQMSYHCTECNTLMQRTYTAPGISFKGNGFYSTDH